MQSETLPNEGANLKKNCFPAIELNERSARDDDGAFSNRADAMIALFTANAVIIMYCVRCAKTRWPCEGCLLASGLTCAVANKQIEATRRNYSGMKAFVLIGASGGSLRNCNEIAWKTHLISFSNTCLQINRVALRN